MRKYGKPLAIAGGIAALVAATSAGTATASSLIGSHDIKDGSIRSVDIKDGGVHQRDLTPHARALLNKAPLAGAVYRVENYTNGGAGDATVACAPDEATSRQYTAIAGGVETGHVESMTGTPNDFSVTASFPGRMDWNTGKPKADRLDGWIVLGNGPLQSSFKVWALCVPTTSIPVQQVDLDN
jgi:hypothetical protein